MKFYHTSLFFPTLQTLSKSIDAGYLTTFTSITSKKVRKYLPRSEVTVKGHLKATKKGLIYSQITSPIINNTIAISESTPAIIEEYGSDDDLTHTPNPSTITPADPSPKSSPTLFPTTTPNDNNISDDMVKNS